MDFVLIFKFNHVGSINVSGEEKQVHLNIEGLGNAALVFLNKKLVEFGNGNHDYGTRYHISRTWIHPGENLLVLHEELGEADPPPVDSWKPNVEFKSRIRQVRLACERGLHISSINFVSLGTPEGSCGTYSPGTCHVNASSIVEKACIGQEECSIPVSSAYLGMPWSVEKPCN
ncbi:hypothetical protein Ddye_019367 [Dipteronia dyeriana]|uniref:SUEL-type lectin domain-containing protein n=1 Tax=Dipteronia dyeriana TaxID=168575 RepID=A0AAD9TY71_9ROSI|nr:hypothetical protein Ddye_019367 [Dipteronia dyeriana]